MVMTISTELNPTQHATLAHAHEHTEGKITWFPYNIKGGARKRVLDGLFNRALITTDGTDWFIAAEGYDALGVSRREPITLDRLEAVITSAQAATEIKTVEVASVAIKRSPRDNTKQAQVIGMLKRPEGATIAQVCEATNWKPHTVRGTFAGAFKRKLGLEIIASKELGADRVYRVVG
jgi:hypothetical protein